MNQSQHQPSRFDLTRLEFLTRAETLAELTKAHDTMMHVALRGRGRKLMTESAKIAREIEELKQLTVDYA